MHDQRLETAKELFQQGYQRQTEGEFDLAVSLYKRSISLYPTAEAYTFLGWAYRYQGKLEEAIEECKKAIATDPDFGNPYNDIGAYLIELNRAEEAVPWLEKAAASRRYDTYHYPWYNLGRVYLKLEMFNRARECFRKSLEMQPGYDLAADAMARLRKLVQ